MADLIFTADAVVIENTVESPRDGGQVGLRLRGLDDSVLPGLRAGALMLFFASDDGMRTFPSLRTEKETARYRITLERIEDAALLVTKTVVGEARRGPLGQESPVEGPQIEGPAT